MSKPGEYYLGLDLGTGSVGWCVTDTEYRIPKVNRRRTIGTVLFSTAETAKERRVIRCARRRLRRQRERLDCLKEMFGEEIAKIDAGLFQRLFRCAVPCKISYYLSLEKGADGRPVSS